MEDGKELSVMLDTGSPTSSLDISLEPKLGKRLGTEEVWTLDTGKASTNRIYAMPKLFLGKTRLVTGNRVFLYDFGGLSARLGHRVMGVIGMDCLANYCLQFDFEARKLRFLDSIPEGATNLGQAFPLIFSNENQRNADDYCPYIRNGCLIVERAGRAEIDTGCNWDGYLKATAFQRAVQGMADASIRTNATAGQGSGHDDAWCPESTWYGVRYKNLLIHQGPENRANIVGLRFLARHLVTLDFPRRMMYLKPRRDGPLAGDLVSQMVAYSTKSPEALMAKLKKTARLPGWPPNARGSIFCAYQDEGNNNAITFVVATDTEGTFYHYRLYREMDGVPWRVTKAWRTDTAGQPTEIRPAP